MLFAACSGSSGDGVPGFSGYVPTFGEDGGSSASPIPTGSVAAVIETKAAFLSEYVLHATFPVPPGTFPRSDGRQPFTIHDYDGTPLETQTEIASRYASTGAGADVVEVMARVTHDPGAGSSSYQSYEVRLDPHVAIASAGSPGIEDLSATANLTANVQSVLADPTAIEIAAYDVFGHKYVCYPLDGTGFHRVQRHGLVQSEVRVFQTMLPVTPTSGTSGTLPHMFGVHSYISTFGQDDLIGLDLRFNNGHSGNDTASDTDDPLDKVYFERIDLTIPDTWYVEGAFEDPLFGNEVVVGGKRTVALVAPIGGGTMHVMEWLAQTHRRLMLATTSFTSAARKVVADGGGQGFCVPGVDPSEGHEYWSWWNRGTARYFTQSYELPMLDHLNIWDLRDDDNDRYNQLDGYLRNGTSFGGYPVAAGNLGWAHPYGVAYGGMTGGDEIYLYDGISTAYSASRLGIQAFKANHRMHTDRQPTALYNIDGEPTAPEDWLVNGTYVPFEYFNTPNLSSGDPFGVGSAPQFQINHVVGTGRAPSYEAALRSFDPHDYQHYIRYTRSPKVLAWLVNDSIAKDDLLMQAESFHLAYHEYDNGTFGNVQGTGMKANQAFVAANPGIGFRYGRGEAWGADCVVAAYAFASPSWRAEVKPWFRSLVDLINDGQAACSGFIQANVGPKLLGGLYRGRQQIEQSITESMLQGMRETVFRGDNQAYTDLTRDILGASLTAFISDMNFIPGFGGIPPSGTAVGPLNINLNPYCVYAQMPSGSWAPDKEGFQDWSSFAWGYEITGNPLFLTRAFGQLKNMGSLYGQMQNGGVANIENRAALIALTQRMN